MNIRFLSKAVVLLSALIMSSSALAITPANTQLQNQAKLVYSGNATGITAQVTVTVSLVTANVVITPVFSEPADQTKPENASFSATYTVYAQNNGVDSYALSSAVQTNNNVTSPGSFTNTPTSIELGATALSVTSTSNGTSFQVPSDGDGAGTYGTPDNIVNGLQANDKIVIGTITYDIATVSDPGTGNATITLQGGQNLPAGTLAVGTGVFESKTFTVDTTDVGSITDTNIAASLVVRTSIDNGNDAAFTDDIQIFIVQINITKYVRCISSCDDSSGTGAFEYDVTDNTTDGGGNNYYTGAVTSNPGGTLEYLIVVENPTASEITGAILSDILPQFTSYVDGSTKMNAGAVDDEAGTNPATNPLLSSADGGGLSLGDTAIGTRGTAEDDGSIGASQTVYVVYRILVTP